MVFSEAKWLRAAKIPPVSPINRESCPSTTRARRMARVDLAADRRREPQSGLPLLCNGTSIASTAFSAAATAASSLPRTTIWLLKRPSLYEG
jgi:hypothetical protein